MITKMRKMGWGHSKIFFSRIIEAEELSFK
jgi:hypothetical protein